MATKKVTMSEDELEAQLIREISDPDLKSVEAVKDLEAKRFAEQERRSGKTKTEQTNLRLPVAFKRRLEQKTDARKTRNPHHTMADEVVHSCTAAWSHE